MGRDLPESYRNRPRGGRPDDADYDGDYGRPSGERSARRPGSPPPPRASMAPRSVPPRGSGERSIPPGGPGGRTLAPGGGAGRTLGPGGPGGPGGFVRRPAPAGDPGDERRSGPSQAYGRPSGPGRRDGYDDTPSRRPASRRDPGYDLSGERRASGPGPDRRRSMASMARDVTKSMSRQLSAVVSRVGRAARELEGPPPRRPSGAGAPPPPRISVPPEVATQLASQPYRRSRARLVARKWRRARVRPNPIGYAVGMMIAILLAVVVFVGGGAGMVYASNFYQAHIGQIQAIADLHNNQNTTFYDRYGRPIYVAKGDNGFRFYRPLSQIAPLVQWMTIDTEDRTFYSNPGIDLVGTLRSALTDVKAGGAAAGGSGITQQLVKNVVLDDATKALQRKINEAILSVGMTVTGTYTKAQILEMYLNTLPYGDQNTGIEAAARNYFGLQPSPDGSVQANQKLDLAQAAILVGLPNNPTEYYPLQWSCSKTPCTIDHWDNPWQGPACGTHIPSFGPDWYFNNGHEYLVYCRALIVLDNLKEYGGPGIHYTDADYEQAKQEVQEILEKEQIFHWAGVNNGSSKDQVSQNYAPHFVQYVTDILNQDFGIDHLESAGLNVYTTLDLDLQNEVQQAVHKYIDTDFCEHWYNDCDPGGLAGSWNAHNGAAVAIDQHTGDILAMVGSADYNSKDPKVAGAVNITTSHLRSMGSATKPIVYATAFQMGWTPGIMMQDAPICFPVPATDDSGKPVHNTYAPACDGWYSPTNYEDTSFWGRFPLRRNFDQSLNIAATEAMEFVGATALTSDNILSMAARLGISTCTEAQIQNHTGCQGWHPGAMGPTTALGTQATPLLQLTGAYATFANLGKRNPPRAILRIEQSDGTVRYDVTHTAPPNTPVLSPQASYMVTNVLTDNFARYPAFGLHNPLVLDAPYNNMQIAAKTGTSSGVNGPRDIVTAGYTPYMTLGVWVGNSDSSDLKAGIIGIAGAGYIFHDVMQWAAGHYKWDPNATFPVAPGIAYANFNCDTGLAPYKDAKDPNMNCMWQSAQVPAGLPNGAKVSIYDPFSYAQVPWVHAHSAIDHDIYIQSEPWLNS